MVKGLIALISLLVSTNVTTPHVQQSQPLDYQMPHNELRMNLHSEPPTVDPGIASDSTSGAIIRAIFDGLTRVGQDGKVHPSVAEKIDVSTDLLTYTFTLRKTKWSNGDPVTANDFVYAWKRVIDPKTYSPYASQLYCVQNAEKAHKGEIALEQVGIKALDDYTLQVTLEHPTPYFLELTSFYTYYPVNQKIVTSNPNWAKEAKTHVGNGPFTIAKWDHKSEIDLIKNESYWDKSAVSLTKIQLPMIEDENVELSMYDNAELDWAGAPLSALPTDAFPYLAESEQLIHVPIAGVYWYKFNVEKAPFNNVKIRKAFTYAINRSKITDDILQGGQTPALGVIPPPMTLKEGGYFHDRDEKLAKTLLGEGMKELGLNSLPPITLMYNTSEAHKNVAENIQEQWKKVLGVNVSLSNMPWREYSIGLEEGNFQVARTGWLADYNDPMTFLQLFKDKNDPNNNTRWENKQYQALLNQSSLETDPGKRNKLLQQAEQILMDEMPVIPLYYYAGTYVQNDRVTGIVLDSSGSIDWKWASAK